MAMAEAAQVSAAPPPGTGSADAAPVEDQAVPCSAPSAFHVVLRQLCEEHDREVAQLRARLQEGLAPLPECTGSTPSRPQYQMHAPAPPPAESLVQLQFNTQSKGGNEEDAPDRDSECVSTFQPTKSVDSDEDLNCSNKQRRSTGVFYQGGKRSLTLTHPLGINESCQEGKDREEDDEDDNFEDSEDESLVAVDADGTSKTEVAEDGRLQSHCSHAGESEICKVTQIGAVSSSMKKQVADGTVLAMKAADAKEGDVEKLKQRAPATHSNTVDIGTLGKQTYVTQPPPKNRSSLLSVQETRISRPTAKPRIVGLKKEGSKSILKQSTDATISQEEGDDVEARPPQQEKRCMFSHRVSWANDVDDLAEEEEVDDGPPSSVFKVRQRWVSDEVTQTDEPVVQKIDVSGVVPSPPSSIRATRGNGTAGSRMSRVMSRGHLFGMLRSNTNLFRTTTTLGVYRVRTWKDIQLLMTKDLVGTPNSKFNFYWDMVSLVLICYDIVMIPMEVFDLKENVVLEAMGFVTGLFWSFDVIRTFFTGYFANGDIEMRMRKIAWNYITTWFFLDVAIVSIDWVRVVMKYSAGGDNAELQGRLRNLRGARALRLLRGVKLRRIFTMIEDRLHSESMAVVFTMIKLFSFLVIINHLCACVWYFIGKTGQDHMDSWLDKYILDSHSFAYRYLTSYHWALTQFTPASISVQPHNVYERAFGVIVLLFALVSVSSFVSGITGAVMSLRSMVAAKSKHFWLLRRYLRENDVPVALALRIQRYCDFAYASQEDRLLEQNVKILGMLSSSLRQELNTAMHEARISWHPLCILLGKLAPQVIVTICNSCVGRLMIVRGNTCFRNGEKANVMYIITNGELFYALEVDMAGKDPEEVVRGMWACEHPLWCEWTTLGSMVAKTNADLVTIDAEKFSSAVHANLTTRREAVVYANHFVQGLNRVKQTKLSDLYQANSIEGLWLRLYSEYGIRRTKEGMSISHRQEHIRENMEYLTTESKLSYMSSRMMQ